MACHTHNHYIVGKQPTPTTTTTTFWDLESTFSHHISTFPIGKLKLIKKSTWIVQNYDLMSEKTPVHKKLKEFFREPYKVYETIRFSRKSRVIKGLKWSKYSVTE